MSDWVETRTIEVHGLAVEITLRDVGHRLPDGDEPMFAVAVNREYGDVHTAGRRVLSELLLAHKAAHPFVPREVGTSVEEASKRIVEGRGMLDDYNLTGTRLPVVTSSRSL